MIYMLRSAGSDYVKIGYTEDERSFKQRVSQLQTGQPWKLETLRLIPEGDRAMEAWFHKHFAQWHTHGEWFIYTPDMLSALPVNPAWDTKARKIASAREYILDEIERLIDLADALTPDVDAETDMTDWEPESDMYFATTDLHEAKRVTWDDCDQEQSTVPLEPVDGCEVMFPLYNPTGHIWTGIEQTRVTRVSKDITLVEDLSWLPPPSELPEGMVIGTYLEFPVEIEP